MFSIVRHLASTPAGLDCFSSWTDFGGCAGGFLETLGPSNGIITIGEKLTGGGAATALGVCEEDPQACEPPPTPPEPPPTAFYKYVTTSQLQEIQENGVLPLGERGQAFFTDEVYESKSVVYDRLSLYQPKDFSQARTQ